MTAPTAGPPADGDRFHVASPRPRILVFLPPKLRRCPPSGKLNGAVDLTQEAVIGRLLWKFLEGEATRSFYRALHAQVRATKQPAVIPFRCDSPSLRRYMRMTIHHEETGQLRYECRMVRTETQRHLKILHPTQARSRACLPVCSCCRRVLLEPMGWLEMLDMSVRLGLFEDELVPRLRHTICPKCAIRPSER